MKRVSFEVAKAIKEAGYPQPQKDSMGYYSTPCNFYFTGSHSYYSECGEQRLYWDETKELHTIEDWGTEDGPRFYGNAIAAPEYLEVWLWLCEKVTAFYPAKYSANNPSGYSCYYSDSERILDVDTFGMHLGPEEAIIAAIEYLTNNNLIK